MVPLLDVVRVLDDMLSTAEIPDYDRALNGLQLTNLGAVTRVAVSVDYSLASLQGAATAKADLLIVHHGMFWTGLEAFVGPAYDRIRAAVLNHLAVYASHLPLDLHPTLGNNTQLASELGLTPDGAFGSFRTVKVGLTGSVEVDTAQLEAQVRTFAARYQTQLVVTPYHPSRRTHRWAILTGAGASSEVLAEAADQGVDTLIVGEGPHHTAVEARDRNITVMYAGHYATETLGVQALGREVNRVFGLPWSFLDIPSGL